MTTKPTDGAKKAAEIRAEVAQLFNGKTHPPLRYFDGITFYMGCYTVAERGGWINEKKAAAQATRIAELETEIEELKKLIPECACTDERCCDVHMKEENQDRQNKLDTATATNGGLVLANIDLKDRVRELEGITRRWVKQAESGSGFKAAEVSHFGHKPENCVYVASLAALTGEGE